MEKKIYLTEYEKDGRSYGDRVEAYSWLGAEVKLILDNRENEEVIGELVAEFEVDNDFFDKVLDFS